MTTATMTPMASSGGGGVTHGMDTAGGREAGREIQTGADALRDIAGRLDAALNGFEWSGGDAEHVRETWRSVDRPALDRTAEHLADLAVVLAREADQQDRVSEVHPLGPAAGVGSAAPAERGFLGRIGDWLDRRISAAWAGLQRSGQYIGSYGGKVLDMLLLRENHSVMELSADLFAATFAAGGAVWNAVTGVDHRVMAEGKGVAGAPVAVPNDPTLSTPERPSLTAPTDLRSLMQSVTDAYVVGGNGERDSVVRIVEVNPGDGRPSSYVVAMPGTEKWNLTSGPMARDTAGNLALAGGHPAAAMESVRRAIEQNVPPGSQVMMAAHSQQGMSAAMLAADPDFRSRYDVTHVLTYGAPIDQVAIPDSVNVLQVQHGWDWVPKLDLGGVHGGWVPGMPQPEPRVVLDSPAPFWDYEENHSYRRYAANVGLEAGRDTPGGQMLRDYQDSLGDYLLREGGSVRAVDVPVYRGR